MKRIQTLMLIVLTTAFCQAECPIECYCDRITTCTGDNILTRFPTKIHSTDSFPNSMSMLRLELHDYAVKHLSRQDFLDILSNLTEISISRNALETFDNETFSHDFSSMSGTSSVAGGRNWGSSSSNNQQQKSDGSGDDDDEFIQRTFSALSTSNGGPVSEVSASTLKLRILDLSQNKLKYFFGGGKLSKLKILDLSSNMLEQVSGLRNMIALESINLRNNKLHSLQADVFQNLRNLQYVNLDSNLLGAIDPSLFSNLPSLAHLILSSNPISNLLPGFYWNSRVQFVDVSNVGLSSIPPSLTKTVRDFRCANNNLTIIRQTDFESYPLVGLLVLDENKIEDIEDDTFGRLDFLSRLWINGNRLKKVPQNLPPSLRSLQLEDNRIVNITANDFKNLKHLEELNFHSNRISSLPPFVFAELTSLKSLDLRSNMIDILYRDSFANLSKLETLDLSQNPIKVIVTGAFQVLRRVTLLHLSRLMEHIEMDVSSFKPLQNLQILELDDSPHLALRMFQEGAFSYFTNIYELNVQRCELEDINLISNALVEIDPQSVKMSENPWDCEDLHGSAIHDLMDRRVIVDQPTCELPAKFKGMRISSLNITTTIPKTSSNALSSGSSEEHQQKSDLVTVTPPLLTRRGDSAEHDFTRSPLSFSESDGNRREHATPSNNQTQTVQNINSLEKGAHVMANSSVTPSPTLAPPLPHEEKTGMPVSELAKNSSSLTNFSTSTTALGSGTRKSSNSSRVLPEASKHGDDYEERRQPSPVTKDGQHLLTRDNEVEANPLVDAEEDGEGGDVVPTLSYFDPIDNSNGLRDSSVSSSSNSKGTNSISSKDDEGRPPPTNKIANTVGEEKETGPGAGRRSSEETKTNDDNTIIDEKSSIRGGGGKSRETGDASSSTAQRSIDGFPLAYPDKDGSGRGKSGSNPKYSYLKLQQHDNGKALKRSRNDLPYDDEDSSSHMAVIVKTLVLSALTCLGTVLGLFFIGLVVYRYSYKRSRVTFPCTRRRCSNDEGEDTQEHQGAGMMYTRFGRRRDSSSHSSHYRHHHQGESDSDQVELSGITNSLYFENEDIYHIT